MKQLKLLDLLNIVLLFFPFLLLGQNPPNEESLHFQLASNQLSVQAIGESILEKSVSSAPTATLFTWNFSDGDASSTGIRMNFETAAENVCFSLLSHAVMFRTAQKTIPPLRIQGISPTGAVVIPTFIFNEGLHAQKELLYYDQLLDESVGVYFNQPVKFIQLSVVGTSQAGNMHTIDVGDIQFLKVPLLLLL